MEYREVMEDIAHVFEAVGVGIMVIGALYAIAAALIVRPGHRRLFSEARRNFGQPLILGLEILVAADIIETVTVERTLESATSLGVIVLVRVLLSFALDVEVGGMFPWRRAEFEAAHPEREP